jgi:hypothetical protein
MPKEYYDEDFPDLKRLGVEPASDPAYYNCIAYVAGDLKRKWWPGEYHPVFSSDYWPPGVPDKDNLEAFVQALSTVGYEYDPSFDGSLEQGVEKVALYALGDNIKHAALQQEDGKWKSKLSDQEDIIHTVEGLNGPAYGRVIAFLKRHREYRVVPPPSHSLTANPQAAGLSV